MEAGDNKPADGDIVEPELIEPEFIEPEFIEPEFIEPESIEPEFIEPGVVGPEIDGAIEGEEEEDENNLQEMLPEVVGGNEEEFSMTELEGEDDEQELVQNVEEEIPEEIEEEAPPPVEEEEDGGGFRFECTDDNKSRSHRLESYCCQQIRIPPLLPHILKSFTKSAIRTQPRDLLSWSYAYFTALANEETPPVKDRLEYPTVESPAGLTKGLLRVLNKQLGKNETVSEELLKEKWTSICLPERELTNLLKQNFFTDEIDWLQFVAVASASIVNNDMIEAMLIFCYAVTTQPDGVDAYIPYLSFANGYTFLAEKMEVSMTIAEDACNFLRELSLANFEMVGPKDFMSPECPPLF